MDGRGRRNEILARGELAGRRSAFRRGGQPVVRVEWQRASRHRWRAGVVRRQLDHGGERRTDDVQPAHALRLHVQETPRRRGVRRRADGNPADVRRRPPPAGRLFDQLVGVLDGRRQRHEPVRRQGVDGLGGGCRRGDRSRGAQAFHAGGRLPDLPAGNQRGTARLGRVRLPLRLSRYGPDGQPPRHASAGGRRLFGIQDEPFLQFPLLGGGARGGAVRRGDGPLAADGRAQLPAAGRERPCSHGGGVGTGTRPAPMRHHVGAGRPLGVDRLAGHAVRDERGVAGDGAARCGARSVGAAREPLRVGGDGERHVRQRGDDARCTPGGRRDGRHAARAARGRERPDGPREARRRHGRHGDAGRGKHGRDGC